jgi:hypothetical protein
MTKNVSVPLVCAPASMAGNKHPIPIAIVDRPRISFNIFYSLEGREFARKEDPSVVCEDNARAMAALCAAIGEAKRGKVTGSCMNVETFVVQCFPFIGLLDKHARSAVDPIKSYLH